MEGEKKRGRFSELKHCTAGQVEPENKLYGTCVREWREKRETWLKNKEDGECIGVMKRDCKTGWKEKSPPCQILNSTGWMSALSCHDLKAGVTCDWSRWERGAESEAVAKAAKRLNKRKILCSSRTHLVTNRE